MKLIEISDLNCHELAIFKERNENALARINEPAPGIFIAESPNVIKRALDAGYEPISVLCSGERLRYGEKNNTENDRNVKMPEPTVSPSVRELFKEYEQLPVYVAKEEVLSEITGYKLTGGLLAALKRKKDNELEKILGTSKRIVVLEEVMNPTNVGAIFRSAAALNMDGVILLKGCADPLYRRAARVSMGTVFQIPWAVFPDRYEKAERLSEGEDISLKLMEKLKNKSFKTVSMALLTDSVNIDDEKLNGEERLAIFMGTEGAGLKKTTIENSDYKVMIPMSHGVDSLNVAAASAVAFYELGKRRK